MDLVCFVGNFNSSSKFINSNSAFFKIINSNSGIEIDAMSDDGCIV